MAQKRRGRKFFHPGHFLGENLPKECPNFSVQSARKNWPFAGGGEGLYPPPPPPRPESVWPLPRPGGGGGHPSLPQTRTPSLRRIMFTSQRAKNKHPNLAFPLVSTPENGAPVYPKVQRPASGPKQSKKVKECAKGQHACKRTLPESVNP